MLFKKLAPREAEGYRQWARDNYKPLSEIDGTWHPVVQYECVKINKTTGFGSGLIVSDAVAEPEAI